MGLVVGVGVVMSVRVDMDEVIVVSSLHCPNQPRLIQLVDTMAELLGRSLLLLLPLGVVVAVVVGVVVT